MKNYNLFALVFAVTATLLATFARAELLVNGSFDAPVQGAGMGTTISPGGEPTGFAWTVASGNIDILDIPISPFILYSAFDGTQVVDLNGFVRGSMFQDFATVSGQLYSLSFAYADNPFEAGMKSASNSVTDVGTMTSLLSDSVSHSTSTNAANGADWQEYMHSFVALGTTTRLMFESTSASNSPSGGIILDAVVVTAVPEPTSFLLVGFGVVGFIARRRCRS